MTTNPLEEVISLLFDEKTILCARAVNFALAQQTIINWPNSDYTSPEYLKAASDYYHTENRLYEAARKI